LAVLAAAPQRPYPPSARRLHARIRQHGVALSELGPDVTPRRWMFPARNRIIAALSAMTVVVQARPGSGALLTAAWAATLGRRLGAVPGEVTAPLAAGPHQLLRDGAELVRGPEDVVETIFGAGARPVGRPPRPRLEPQLQALLDALADTRHPAEAIDAAGLDLDRGLTALAELELGGRIAREPGGGFTVMP
ncbi:MAG: DNA-processing protein DprA, partial [Solirubrobacteraceae bacterium]